MRQTPLDLADIQGDVLQGLQKNHENFIFFKIASPVSFKHLTKIWTLRSITTADRVHDRELASDLRKRRGQKAYESFQGLNLGITKTGLDRLIGAGRPKLDPAFERGADCPETIEALNDPPKSLWLRNFVTDRIDGVFLITGPTLSSVTMHSNELLRSLGSSIQVVYSEIGNVRPGAQRGHEHFGFLDGVSQPGIRGLTQKSDSIYRPDEGVPGQDLLWPGSSCSAIRDSIRTIRSKKVRLRQWQCRGCTMGLSWCSGGSSRKCRNFADLSPSARPASAWTGNCSRRVWSAAGGAARRWSWRRYATTRRSEQTKTAIMISNSATIRFSANVHTRRIFERYIPA